jgi:hypothetical protein
LETTLHQQLKLQYASEPDLTEVFRAGFRIDAVGRDGELIEIQHSSLGALRRKTDRLLSDKGRYRVRIVKPIFVRKRVTTLNRPGGKIIRSRFSPKRSDCLDLFIDLVHFSTVFPRKRLTLEILLIEAEEIRVDRPARRARGKSYRTLDMRLIRSDDSISLQTTKDLLGLLPMKQLPREFDTKQLAEAMERPRWFAQKVAYCLRTMGAIQSVERRRNAHLYQLSPTRSASPRKSRAKAA